ncbi:helix-turn-helix transcriptional regulator [Nocardia otitidiscaviarum]|nr:helix-turn-helix transcriptional regulator [Nocardia otitidiscaviarum]MBF6487864.1 helix-turn-helix transcriptional regulator [Nocardia otitidiscaviarum]
MNRNCYRYTVSNPVAATFDLLGDRLTLTILRYAFTQRACRFNQWLDYTGAPPAVLTARLSALVEAGVLARVPRAGTVDRHEYRLTELGLATWEILVCVWAWQREWTAEGARLPEFVHGACGHRGPPMLMCHACGRGVTTHDTAVELAEDVLWQLTSGRRRSSRGAAGARADVRFDEIMQAIGDRWSAAVTGLALAGVRRFGEFREVLRMSPTTLTERLNRLCEAGMLWRPEDAGGREYRLTPRGRGLFGVFAFLLAWADLAYPEGPESGIRIRHLDCGETLLPALRCRGCDARLGRTAVRFEPLSGVDTKD